ncbi:VOC family protein [Flavobacterium sp.]|uniref:bleomycin resistance protein n=1 Tax=Flavobacterium sp. TaxID=239 RepID=UPI00262A1CFE|nr:VOC family protein [Flavobacterium sp.]MDG2432493.1 VOC family protein [Flavobacterium sp.]
MLTAVHPKLAMRNKITTREFYVEQLGFEQLGDYDGYLMVKKDQIEIHFFEFKELNIFENYGQVYIRTNDIETLYQEVQENKITIHPNGKLKVQPWGQKEFSMLDPDKNLLTFGQNV